MGYVWKLWKLAITVNLIPLWGIHMEIRSQTSCVAGGIFNDQMKAVSVINSVASMILMNLC